jgi:hypothetical protein
VVSWRRVFLDVDFNRTRQFEKYGVDNVTRTGVLQFSTDGKQRHIVNKMIGYGFMSNVIRYLSPTPNKELLLGNTAEFLENVDKPNRPKTAPASRGAVAAVVNVQANQKPESQQHASTAAAVILPSIHRGEEADKTRKKSLCFSEQAETGLTRIAESEERSNGNAELTAQSHSRGDRPTEEQGVQHQEEEENERVRRHSASHSLIPADPLRLKLKNQQYASAKTKSKKMLFDETMRRYTCSSLTSLFL